MSNGAQRRQVNFGVDGGGLFGLMAQYFGDLGHGRSIAEHLGSERMAKQVRPSGGRVNSSASESSLHDNVDGRGVGESFVRSRRSNEDSPAYARRPKLLQIICEGLAHIFREG